MRRRTLLATAGAIALAGTGALALGRTRRSSGPRITRVSGWRIEAPRTKPIGRNAQLDVHARMAHDILVRIDTNAGVSGFGPGGGPSARFAELPGLDPLALFDPGYGLRAPVGRRDIALWDLVGKLLDTPVWRLLGGQGAERIPVYDGSFYFADLLPEFQHRGVDRMREEIDASLAQGHRAFKLKVGRGHRWMPPDEGFRRDVEVVQAVRRHLGPSYRVMVDANDGYDLATTLRFLDAIDDELFFVEEMFPERVEDDLALRAYIRGRGWRTLVADGETVGDPAAYDPLLVARAVDVLQPNILGWGLGALRELADRTAPLGIRLAPNNWDSHLGLYAQLVLARGIPNFLIAEQDPGVADVVDLAGFTVRDGFATVPDAAGCGWSVDPGRLAQRARRVWQFG